MNSLQTTSRTRGAKGFVAPEWFKNCPTVNVDAYSHGILLLIDIVIYLCTWHQNFFNCKIICYIEKHLQYPSIIIHTSTPLQSPPWWCPRKQIAWKIIIIITQTKSYLLFFLAARNKHKLQLGRLLFLRLNVKVQLHGGCPEEFSKPEAVSSVSVWVYI